ncbi:unnamed protein product [Blepharisma stoltei]|uniref:C2H2-type domain-containing protein n=1 Tax=Blepharisma stoltei TaxID=1481888 RepID=A0AAU9KF17_9CILI|nr:unnamed protein product [Blepharisma stoltei]
MQRITSELDNKSLPRPFSLITAEAEDNPESRTYKCDSCGLVFLSFFGLKIHKSSDRESSGLLSSGVSLKTPSSPTSQIVTNSCSQVVKQEETPKPCTTEVLFCKDCKKEFKTFKGLQQHIGKVHEVENKQAYCHICLKKFRHKHAVKFHINQVHDKTTRISCEFCKKSLYNKYLLDEHMKRCPVKADYYQ